MNVWSPLGATRSGPEGKGERLMAAHPIVHVEFPASDPKAASKFYADLFGWQIQTDPNFADYPMFQAEGGPGGGFVKTGTDAGGGLSYQAGERRGPSFAITLRERARLRASAARYGGDCTRNRRPTRRPARPQSGE